MRDYFPTSPLLLITGLPSSAHTHTHTHTHTRARLHTHTCTHTGSMFKLHEYRWAIAIEAIIGKDLSAFVVDNPYDRATLQRIMSRVLNGQRGPDVLTSRFTVRDLLCCMPNGSLGYAAVCDGRTLCGTQCGTGYWFAQCTWSCVATVRSPLVNIVYIPYTSVYMYYI